MFGVGAAIVKYRAFLSYSHADSGMAKRVHARLEGFRIDRELVGRTTVTGLIPASLRPIFHDRSDFDAGSELGAQTIATLDASAALVVLASPHAAKSHYVNEEARVFKSRQPDRPIIPLIVEGEPGEPERECFPLAVRFAVTADGAVTQTPSDVLAADLRETGDGFDLALAKVVARLLGLPPDDVYRRAERERRRQGRWRNGVVAVLVVLTIAATVSAAYAWRQLKTNEAFLDATLKRATEIVNTAVAQAEKYNVPRSATLALLGRAEGLFDDMATYGRPTSELRLRKAQMSIQFARNYAILGDTRKQAARATTAYGLLADLAKERPDDLEYSANLASADDELGDAQVARGDLAGALKSYRAGLAIADRLAKAGNAEAEHDLSVSYEKIGDVQVAQGDLANALTSYQARLAIADRLSETYPDNAGWQRDLSASYERVGEVQVEQGDLAEALKSYQASLDIRAKADPGNLEWRRDLSVSQQKFGDVQVAQGDLAGALTSYQAGLAIADRLAMADPGNAGWKRDLSVSHEKVGDVRAARGDLAGALASYQADLAIRERLSRSDPDHTGWQRDLSVAGNKVGDMETALGDLAGARTSYQASLDIRDRLAKADPGNSGWQRDLSASFSRTGNVLVAQGDLAGALKSYQASLAIADRLAAADPGNAGWRRDLSVSHNKVGDVLVAQGDLGGALKSYQASLDIRDRLAKADPGNAGWQRDLSASYANLASVFSKIGQSDKARQALLAGRAILSDLIARYPDWAEWKQAAARFDEQLQAVGPK